MKTGNAWKIYRTFLQDLQRISPEAEAEARILWTSLGGSWPPTLGPAPNTSQLRGALQARQKRVPLAYVLGEVEFLGIPIRVRPGVFIPRVDTETLILTVQTYITKRTRVLRVADIGTGTGCLAIALALHYPRARLWAIDRSPMAVRTARENTARYRLESRVWVLRGDLLQAFRPHTLDLVVTNPPYIPTSHLPTLPPEVQQEPKEALDGGPDGLSVIRPLLQQALDALVPGGWLFMEIAPPVRDRVIHTAKRFGYRLVAMEKDLGGIDRVLVLRTPS